MRERRASGKQSEPWENGGSLGGGGGGDSNIKKVGVLVVSLRGVNFRFWSRLGCWGKITNIFSLQGLFLRVAREEIQQFFLKNLFY